MRKILYTVLILLLTAANINSQNLSGGGEKQSMEDRFMTSDLQGKLKIITSVKPSEESYSLYKKAAEYSALNSGFYKNDPFFDEIYTISVSGMLSILNSSKKSRLKAGSSSISELLDFISSKPEAALLPYLYRMKNLKYSEEIVKKAEYIFRSSKVPFFSAASDIIVKNPVQDKLEILSEVLESSSLSLMEKGELACRAMEAAFSYKVSDHRETESLKDLLVSCVDLVYELGWSEASPLVLQYFDQLIAYEDKDAVRETLLKTIKTLGILGTHEAAVRLSMYIGLINSFAEQGLDYDEEILMEIVKSLGQIGDLAAYENLSNMEKIPGYSRETLELAKESLSKLEISR